MLIEKLRERTKHTHEALEQSMFPIIKKVQDVATYAKLLRLFYGYYKPLQDNIDAFIDVEKFPDYGKLRRAEWILEDLTALGEPKNVIPVYQFDFSIETHVDAIGALYVTEGSTLGGKIICKTIATNLGKTDEQGLKFFNGYGTETGSRWKTFMAMLNSYKDADEQIAIIESANQVFAGFKEFIDL